MNQSSENGLRPSKVTIVEQPSYNATDAPTNALQPGATSTNQMHIFRKKNILLSIEKQLTVIEMYTTEHWAIIRVVVVPDHSGSSLKIPEKVVGVVRVMML